jgi:hypothetical protein
LYTNEVRKIVAVPSPFGFATPLSEVLSFVCAPSSSFRLCTREFSSRKFHFGKAKSAMLKIVSSDASALDAVVPFWKAVRSVTHSAAREYPVKK